MVFRPEPLALRAAAALGPTKVTKLALYEPPYGHDTKEFEQQKQQVNEIITSGRPGEAAAFFLSALGTPPDALEGMKASPEWDAIKRIDRTLAYDFEVMVLARCRQTSPGQSPFLLSL